MFQLPIPQQEISSTTVRPLPHSFTLTVTSTSETGSNVNPGDITPDVRTMAPQTVEVILSAAADSPSEVFFTLLKGAQGKIPGESFFMVNLYPGQRQSIYLLPGEYTYAVNAPMPTPPLRCFNITESFGWSDGGNFTVAREKIEIKAKLGFILIFCTPAPGS